MHAVHERQLLVLIALAFVWALGSWHWYTCGIKGFCAPASFALRAEYPCQNYLSTSVRRGWANDEDDVRRLQAFLNEYEGERLALTGSYGEADEWAVRRFQHKYRSDVLAPWGKTEPTGFVHETTRAKVNALHCARQGNSI